MDDHRVLVTGVVGLVVASHQPRNPIGWLLAGEAVFILLSVAGGAYANLVYQHGYHELAFAGPLALVLDQLFNYLLVGFPLVILLFPDGRLPSRRWRPVVGIYLAITAASLLATSVAVLILVAGHHVGYQTGGNLTSLGHWGTAWVIPVQVAFLLTVGAFWLAAIARQALSWRRSDGERRQQLKWLASGAAVCGVFGIWAIVAAGRVSAGSGGASRLERRLRCGGWAAERVPGDRLRQERLVHPGSLAARVRECQIPRYWRHVGRPKPA